jgi:hypothetical protein
MVVSPNRYGFLPHTRGELQDATAGPALDASWLPSFSVAFAKLRGTQGRLVALHRVKAVIAYGDVEFAARLEDVILPTNPEYQRVAALVLAEADLARKEIDAGREQVAQARAERRSLPRKAPSRPRDQQRSRVYAWERAVLGRPADSPSLSLQECQALVDAWGRDFDLDAIRVTDGRGRRKACWSRTDRTIRLPRWSRVPWVIAHEIAHAWVDAVFERGTVAAHGPEFVSRFIEVLVQEIPETSPDLIASASEHGIMVA